jgi:hypothetical protein
MTNKLLAFRDSLSVGLVVSGIATIIDVNTCGYQVEADTTEVAKLHDSETPVAE